jgi:hypothetical protein
MTFDEAVLDVLQRLVKIHRDTAELVDFNVEDRRRAIWYLQGSSISTAYSIFGMYKNGYAVGASHEWRFVNELRDLVALFDGMSDDNKNDIRKIKAWYKGRIVERERHELLSSKDITNLGDDFYIREKKIKNQLLDELSIFAHPSINASRYNVYKLPIGEVYDYEWSRLKDFEDIKVPIYASLTCAIHCLITPQRTLNQTQEVRDELNTLYEYVENNLKK